MPGKILVYPSKKGMPLTALAGKQWDMAAEKELLGS
jgi:hypothetical protein